MRKPKIIASLCMLVLTIAALSFGVYSAIKTSFTASGTVTFNAYGIDADLKMDISGTKESYDTYYASSTPNRTKHFALSDTDNNDNVTYNSLSTARTGIKFQFNELYIPSGADEAENKIAITFLVANFSGFNVKVYANITGAAVEKLNITQTSPIISIEEYDADNMIISKSFKIEISPKQGVAKFEEDINIEVKFEPFTKYDIVSTFGNNPASDWSSVVECSDTKIVANLLDAKVFRILFDQTICTKGIYTFSFDYALKDGVSEDTAMASIWASVYFKTMEDSGGFITGGTDLFYDLICGNQMPYNQTYSNAKLLRWDFGAFYSGVEIEKYSELFSKLTLTITMP